MLVISNINDDVSSFVHYSIANEMSSSENWRNKTETEEDTICYSVVSCYIIYWIKMERKKRYESWEALILCDDIHQEERKVREMRKVFIAVGDTMQMPTMNAREWTE